MNNSSCSGNSRELIVRSFPEKRVQMHEFNFEKKLFRNSRSIFRDVVILNPFRKSYLLGEVGHHLLWVPGDLQAVSRELPVKL